MIAAIRSRLECRASDSTPKLPVAAVRNSFSDTRTTAEPTEASAASCLAELGFELEICDSPGIVQRRLTRLYDGAASSAGDCGVQS